MLKLRFEHATKKKPHGTDLNGRQRMLSLQYEPGPTIDGDRGTASIPTA